MKETKLMKACLPLAALAALACGSNGPSAASADFVVAVGDDERFVLRLTDPASIAAAYANLRGENQQFPIGPLVRGDGGFNQPWSWHVDPEQARLTEAAIELCDGRPSYVEEHVSDYVASGYCPWGARVVSVKP